MTLITGPGAAAPGPHGEHDGDSDGGGGEPGIGLAPARRASRLAAWVRHAPAERAPALGIPAAWAAAEIMHVTGASPVLAGAATLAAAGLAYGTGEKRGRAEAEREAAQPGTARPRLRGAELAAAAGGVGAWATAAAVWGPLAGPFDLLTLVYGAGAAGGYWWLRCHEAVRAARARRDAAADAAARAAAEEAAWLARRAEWHALAAAPGVGLHGSHLMAAHPNLNGEEWVIDLYSTRKLASQVDCRQLGQRLAGERGVPRGRVEVVPDPDWVYRLHVRFRAADPWKGGSADAFIWHPSVTGAYDPGAPFAALVPPAASILDPVGLGADPETGAPLELPLFTSNGAQRVLVVATSGSGKSMLLDTIRERVTACTDAVLLQINLSKGVEDSWWEPLTEASALASDADPAARALAILDFITDAITARPYAPARKAGARMHHPTPAEPALVLMIDEYDEVSRDPDRKRAVESIASKCRSEGIPLILATQRAVGKWVSTTLKANISQLVWSKMRDSDARHVSGSDSFELPDMGAYGGGNKGIFGVCEHPTFPGMPHLRGRAFFWGDDSPGLMRLITARAAARRPYVLEPALAPLAARWAAITSGGVPAGDGRYDVTTARDGTAVPGMAGVRGKLAAVAGMLAGPPGLARERPATDAPARLQGRQDDPRPRPGPQDSAQAAMATLRALVARPGGVSVREAADEVPFQKTKTHELLAALCDQGAAEVRGRGPAARFYAPGAPGPGPYPPLRALPDPPPQASGGAP
jgi:hypothetical protein